MNKELKIINEVYYWKDKLCLPYFVLDINNRTKYAGFVEEYQDGIAKLTLNIKSIKKYQPIDVLSIIFHEFGHIVTGTHLQSFKGNELDAEILAERWNLDMICKYCTAEQYQDYYDGMRKAVLDKYWKKFPVHQKAFEKIYI